ncbi:MAG: hypothetical protein WA830_11395 [Candidatus Sulfotelmatobacter sp.]
MRVLPIAESNERGTPNYTRERGRGERLLNGVGGGRGALLDRTAGGGRPHMDR